MQSSNLVPEAIPSPRSTILTFHPHSNSPASHLKKKEKNLHIVHFLHSAWLLQRFTRHKVTHELDVWLYSFCLLSDVAWSHESAESSSSSWCMGCTGGKSGICSRRAPGWPECGWPPQPPAPGGGDPDILGVTWEDTCGTKSAKVSTGTTRREHCMSHHERETRHETSARRLRSAG